MRQGLSLCTRLQHGGPWETRKGLQSRPRTGRLQQWRSLRQQWRGQLPAELGRDAAAGWVQFKRFRQWPGTRWLGRPKRRQALGGEWCGPAHWASTSAYGPGGARMCSNSRDTAPMLSGKPVNYSLTSLLVEAACFACLAPPVRVQLSSPDGCSIGCFCARLECIACSYCSVQHARQSLLVC